MTMTGGCYSTMENVKGLHTCMLTIDHIDNETAHVCCCDATWPIVDRDRDWLIQRTEMIDGIRRRLDAGDDPERIVNGER